MSEQTFILPHGKPALMAFLDRLPSEKKWRVTVSRHHKTRSNEQNRALFGVAYKTIREATGNDIDDLHTLMCGEYFSWVETEVLGKKRMKPRRTTTTDENGKRDVLSTADFSDFYAFVQQKAAEYGVYVPSPGEDETL